MIDCSYNMPPGACACDIPGPDFYDSDAQQLAAETAYELFEFSLLRGRRERQWQRLHPTGNPFLWALEDGPYDFEVVSGIQLAFRHGHWNPSPVHRLFCLSRLNRDRHKITRSKVGGLRPWDVSKLLDGGLRLTERGPGLAEHGCEGCGDDSRVCGC